MVSTNIASNGLDFDKLEEFQFISRSAFPVAASGRLAVNLLDYLPLNTGRHLTNRIYQKYMSSVVYVDQELKRASESPVSILRDILEDILARSCKDFQWFTKKLLLDYGGCIVSKKSAHRERYKLTPYPEAAKAYYCLSFGKSFSSIFEKRQPFLNDFFQLRHIVSHNDSVVDEKYLKYTVHLGYDLRATLGSPIILEQNLIVHGVNIMMKICVELALELNQIQKIRRAS